MTCTLSCQSIKKKKKKKKKNQRFSIIKMYMKNMTYLSRNARYKLYLYRKFKFKNIYIKVNKYIYMQENII